MPARARVGPFLAQTMGRTRIVGSALAAALTLAPSLARSDCWDEAAARYGLPVTLLQAIAQVESGLDPKARSAPNKDASHDIGLMQINSRWRPVLATYGIREADLYDACTNLHVGAWVLAHNIARLGWDWDAIGAYNAGCQRLAREACRDLRTRYAWRVWRAWQRLLPASDSSTATVRSR
jgi:soluble lytic murein transglycosylase-like protein